MEHTINFAIDLGTTNSLIAKGGNGSVTIFKNPAGMKMTLPSVVAFRKDRILIGDKAREYIEKDPSNVFGFFKRKMGTSETFFVPHSGTFKTPIELSAIILQELKNFIFTGETPGSVVITIPASFDTIQSNATKEAGYAAGFREVLLLQEPIAASLAFANKESKEELKGQWLVYDLGGGTYDVALIRIENDEMKVIDHEGDNYFGGVDFDNLILSGIIVPYLAEKYAIEDLLVKMRSADGPFNKLYYQLLYKAEEIKIALSAHPTAEMEFDFTDEQGRTSEEYVTITRDQFEGCIRDRILSSITFIRSLLERNKLTPAAVAEIVLVGGSTYIPLVRNLLTKELGIPVNASIDPTTAVVEGAAWYAGSRSSSLAATEIERPAVNPSPSDPSPSTVEVRMAYSKNSKDNEEYFAAAIQNAPEGSRYRIGRSDGGYDSGLKPLAPRINEMLPLLPNTVNVFRLRFFDAKGMPVAANLPDITIVQGKFSIHGQPLPNDICLEVDDTHSKVTQLEVIFQRNAILPLRKTTTKVLSRTIAKGSDDQLLINVLEGSRYSAPQTNLPIGFISIGGKDLQTDLIKGCDIELTFEISESRDITVTAYIPMIDQEYKEVFNPSSRAVNLSRLKEEIDFLRRTANSRLNILLANERYEEGAVLQQAVQDIDAMQEKLRSIGPKDVTDVKFQLDDQKRKIAQTIESVAKGETQTLLREEYFEKKEYYRELLTASGQPELLRKFDEMNAQETEWINTASTQFLRVRIKEMDRLVWEVRRKDLHYVTWLYTVYAMKPLEAFSNPKEIKALRARGDEALTRKNIDEILTIIYRMYDLLIDKNDGETIKGTGLRG
ncbi:MAG TPA: Hsp70 family protein [Puia sp.]|nr:Hsp70 family protein [Puia sp.]